jgi:hypothetical protein
MAATTTTYGYKMPTRNDRGDEVFDALEANITRSDIHTHDGSNGAQINPKDLSKTTTTLALASWAAVAGQTGTYRQLLTVPSGYTVDASVIKCFVGSGADAGDVLFLTIEKESATTAYVYINDNTIDVKVTYA